MKYKYGIVGVVMAAVVAAAFWGGYWAGTSSEVARHTENLLATNVTERVEKKIAAEVKKNEPVKIARVCSASLSSDGTLAVRFSQKPEIKDIEHYIVTEPKVENVSVTWNSEDWGSNCRVNLKSRDFRFGTPYTVVVRPTLPFPGGWKLEKEYRRTLTRPNFDPSVSFADGGRYLPPIGDRAVGIEHVNVSNIECEIRYVLPENIIQMLAREERQYPKSMSWWSSGSADSAATAEISDLPHNWKVAVTNPPNERLKQIVPLTDENGVVSNGVYLMSVKNADKGDDWKHRLVCVTDIGLSVRKDDYGLSVWVTSLTTGKPIADAEAIVYASSRVELARGRTAADGQVKLDGWDARYEPFALVVTKKDRSDSVFMAVRETNEIDEPLACGNRPEYLEAEECNAFVWTERGIYRHGEKVMVHAVLRNGKGNAPAPFPVKIELLNPSGRIVGEIGKVTDEFGAVHYDEFVIPDEQPSGKWNVRVLIPGKDGKLLGERTIKIEDFVPPQIKVSLKNLPEGKCDPTNLSFTVAAEHLFGGPAKKLTAEAVVTFADEEFAPAGWKDFRFGDNRRGLQPNLTRLPPRLTDDKGEMEYTVAMNKDWGKPRAAVKMTVQGSVLEMGGRPSITRGECVIHKYPYYLGSDIPSYVKQQPGTARFRVVQVNPDGTAHKVPRKLKAELWRIDYVYNLVKNGGGWTWDSQRVSNRIRINTEVAVGENGEGVVEVPVDGSGDYELAVTDEDLGLSHCAEFWISSDGDDVARASMKNPREVTIEPDRKLYREGDCPRLTIKSPFRGSAWLSVMREKTIYTKVLELTNLTSVVELDALKGEWAPNVDVAISVVQSVEAGKNHLASRAHGIVQLPIRTRDSEIPVRLSSEVRIKGEGEESTRVSVNVEAPGAERVVVTLVDEGINILTGEKTPDPIGFFSTVRGGDHPLYDLFNRLLPVYDSQLKASGVKTGGGGCEEMMSRVSPVPTRRFKPLCQWTLDVPLTDGHAVVDFKLPEFVGEVRVTAVAYSKRGTGSASMQKKVCPKLVMMPDAPRFAAPGDEFNITLSLMNRAGADGVVKYGIESDQGAVSSDQVRIANDEMTNIVMKIRTPVMIGEMKIKYRAEGYGETHEAEILLPVRPAVAWEEKNEVVAVKPGGAVKSENVTSRGRSGYGESVGALTKWTISVSDSPIAELVAAFDYLAEYPYGCLEQTSSRIFPLLNAEEFLKRLPSDRTSKAAELRAIVKSGVDRVQSMIRATDFTMWPDCNYAPWDREVSVYAADFLVSSEKAGFKLSWTAKDRIKRFLKKWAYDKSPDISAYACYVLALEGSAVERDRMFSLYDGRAKLSLISRARLAYAFLLSGTPDNAVKLVSEPSFVPTSVKEAAVTLETLMALDADDKRIPALVVYLNRHRDRERFHWGTTSDNAYALRALASYYTMNGLGNGNAECFIEGGETLVPGKPKKLVGGGDVVIRNAGSAEAYVSLKKLYLPEVGSVTNSHRVINISRKFYTSEGLEADLNNIARGELLVGEITLTTDSDFDFNDLVIQDLLPAGLEPDRREVADAYAKCHGRGDTSWVMRSDVRDDRVLVFSKKFRLLKGENGKKFYYAVRAVSAGDFVLPGTVVEGMYNPDIRAVCAPGRIVVRH